MNSIKKEAIITIVLYNICILLYLFAIGFGIHAIIIHFINKNYNEMLYLIIFSIVYFIWLGKKMNHLPKELKECYDVIVSNQVDANEDFMFVDNNENAFLKI
jgi:uncharacterized membrane protein